MLHAMMILTSVIQLKTAHHDKPNVTIPDNHVNHVAIECAFEV
jgi:hypothetical protein